MERWNRMPEWARWTLLFPILLLGSVIIAIGTRLIFVVVGFLNPAPSWEWSKFLWYRLIEPFMISSVIIAGNYEMLFALTPPRGRRPLGWVFFILLTTAAALGTLLLVGSRLGSWGLLSLPPWMDVWKESDWGELAGTVALLTSGTAAFRHYQSRIHSGSG
jgi:hypothetical protein